MSKKPEKKKQKQHDAMIAEIDRKTRTRGEEVHLNKKQRILILVIVGVFVLTMIAMRSVADMFYGPNAIFPVS